MWVWRISWSFSMSSILQKDQWLVWKQYFFSFFFFFSLLSTGTIFSYSYWNKILFWKGLFFFLTNFTFFLLVENVELLLKLGDRYNFESVLVKCENFLITEKADDIDVFIRLEWASKYAMADLQVKLLRIFTVFASFFMKSFLNMKPCIRVNWDDSSQTIVVRTFSALGFSYGLTALEESGRLHSLLCSWDSGS